MPKERADSLLVKKGLADSASHAQRLIMAGQVRADGQVVLKPSTSVADSAQLEVDTGPPFVSRGGEKLEAALHAFDLQVVGKICADVGASTGGFTDCLLQHGASKVYAIDVGRGILHWELRQDPRVVVMERTNARNLKRLPEPVAIVTIDASFISLKVLLPVVRGWFGAPGGHLAVEGESGLHGEVVALIKPQFEAGRRESARGQGVITDAAVHRRVLLQVLGFAQNEGYTARSLMRSPLLGPKGNVEFLAHLTYPQTSPAELASMVADV